MRWPSAPPRGITLDGAPRYLALKTVLCVGGGWIVSKAAVADGDWPRITALAAAAAALPRASTAQHS